MSIEKNLVIRIGGDAAGFNDTLAGVLGSLGKLSLAAIGVKLAYDAISGGLSAIKESILTGGELNETLTGYQNLADNLGRSASGYVAIVQEVSSNTKALSESINAAGNAMKFGFSEDQFRTIATYSKRYTEAFGGDWSEMAYAIEKALATGRTMALKEFGIMAEQGQKMSDVLKQITERTALLGEGAYNIGDDLTSLSKILQSAGESFGIYFNRLIGEAGFGEAFAWVREGLLGLVDIAPKAAAALFEIGDIIFGDIISSVKMAYSGFSQLFEMVFGYPLKIRDQISIIGTELLIFVTDVISRIKAFWLDSIAVMMTPLLAILKLANESSSWLREKLGMSTEESRRQYMELDLFIKGVVGMGDAVRADQEKFAKQLRDTPPLFSEVEKASTKALSLVGEGFEKTTGKAKAAKQEVQNFLTLWDSATAKPGEVSKKYTLWDADVNKVGEVYQKSGSSLSSRTLWDNSTHKVGEVYQDQRGAATAQQAAKSGSPSIILQAPRGDKIGEAIAEWLNKAAMAEGTLRAGM